MSEVAVKIYESRRDIQRLHLAETIYGKDGPNQRGKWLDSDTGQPIDHVLYDRIGQYKLEYVLIGENLDETSGPFEEVEGEHHMHTEQLLHNGELTQWQSIYFVSKPGLKVPIGDIMDLEPNSVVKHYYFCLRFIDD